MPLLPDVQFGSATEPVDWRNMPDDGMPDDDSVPEESSVDLVGMLGFDPLDDDGEVEKMDVAADLALEPYVPLAKALPQVVLAQNRLHEKTRQFLHDLGIKLAEEVRRHGRA